MWLCHFQSSFHLQLHSALYIRLGQILKSSFIFSHAMECMQNGLKGFPLWTGIVIAISHLLLAINSATNILIYCALSSQFRQECKKVFGKL